MLTFRPPALRLSVRKAEPSDTQRIIAQLSPKMQRAIQQALEDAQGALDLETLTQLIATGRTGEILRGLDQVDLTDAQAIIVEALAAGAALGTKAIKGAYRFDVTNTAALEAADALAADLLTAASDETKAIVRRLITRAYREQITARDTARMVKDVVGLNDRQATALANFRAGLVEDGVGDDAIAKQVGAYGKRLLTQRSKMIARTEIHKASHRGQHTLWKEAVKAGRLNPARARRFWIPNDNACPWCEEIADINEDGVTIDGQFLTPDGDMIDGPEDSHPQCECGQGLDAG